MTDQDIKARFKALKAEQPKLRARNAAQELGISEGELVAAHVGETATRLREDDLRPLLQSLKPLGEMMALSRNEACVHERHGVFDHLEFEDHGKMAIGMFVNPDIDTRMFINHWRHIFAVQEQTQSGLRKSFQFYDKQGDAIHKIYLTPKSNEELFDGIVEKFTHDDQTPSIITESYDPPQPNKQDSEVDWDKFRTSWENMKDTHDFYPMLRKYKIGRIQALTHAGDDFAFEVDNSATRHILEMARDKECPIMVFVGNRGIVQIHTGSVKKLMDFGTWYNVLDPEFNMHLNEEHVAKTWVTKKPTEDGIVTALEVFDKNDDLIVTFFGKRKPGIPELELWREIIATLQPKDVRHAA